MQARTTTVGDPQGLHAQLAHQLSQVAGGFSASLWIRHAGRRASLADPIQILALAAGEGAEVTVIADGLDEVEAIEAISGLIGLSAPSAPTG
ncbi:MAG: HPr family phosphocarrier protein [Micropruina sp.]